MRRYAFEAFITHLLWCFFLFAFTDGFGLPLAQWLENFYQWDARWYGSMALDGYGFLPQTYVFPPLHGWVLGRLTDVAFFISGLLQEKPSWTHCFYVVALVFGVTCFAVANTVLVWLAENRWRIERRRLWAFAISNPMAYFAFSAYSDLFFFALMTITTTVAIWTGPRRAAWRLPELSSRNERYARALLTLLIFLNPWVRLTGFAFAAWVFLKRKETIATFASLALLLGFDWYRTGNPLFFLLGQKAFMMPDGGILKGTTDAFRILLAFFDGTAFLDGEFLVYAVNFGLLPIAALVLSLALIVWLFRRREYEWAWLLLAVVAISHNQAFWRSTVRYTLPLYPMFFWLLWANVAEKNNAEKQSGSLARRIVTALFVALGLTIQVFYARLFHVGAWAF